ncbi:phage tail tape measure protein [Rhodobacter capsulatus]|uniref:Phage tail tape measure protein n=1 Tax=Rhodobacter capsulatus TaxID=1061 RepID=A0A4U1JT73_RHOCA|nr:phage tail tape measure protein [Rhodobacter capsulatus]TKD22325.1 phage tail tape measure protein [Rhodobacter capsulatus]
MVEVDGLDALSRQAAELEQALGGAEGVAASFNDELGRMRESLTYTGREVGSLSQSFGRSVRRAFDGVIFDGMKLSDALSSVAEGMTQAAYSVAMRPVQDAIGGAIASSISGMLGGVFGFAQGGAFSQGRVMPFAKGGVVSSPTTFPMRGATGLMGEAGPEAILPLARGADGRLGVQAGGGRVINVVMNVTTPDAAGFARSQSQIAAQVNRALARGSRNA